MARRLRPHSTLGVALILAATALSGVAGQPPELSLVDEPRGVLDHVPGKSPLIVMNLWATWCAPCIAEMDDLVALDRAFDDDDVSMIGISVDDWIPGDRKETIEKVRLFLSEKNVEYPNLFYIGRPDALLDLYRVRNGIPVTIVLDREGYVLEVHEGAIDRRKMTALLNTLLKRTRSRE